MRHLRLNCYVPRRITVPMVRPSRMSTRIAFSLVLLMAFFGLWYAAHQLADPAGSVSTGGADQRRRLGRFRVHAGRRGDPVVPWHCRGVGKRLPQMKTAGTDTSQIDNRSLGDVLLSICEHQFLICLCGKFFTLTAKDARSPTLHHPDAYTAGGRGGDWGRLARTRWPTARRGSRPRTAVVDGASSA